MTEGIPPTREQVLWELETALDRLEVLLQRLTPEDLERSSASGEWTIRQILHHLSDDGDAWCMPLKRAIVAPGSHMCFGEFPGNDTWAEGLDFAQRDARPAIDLLFAHRRLMASLVRDFPDAWENTIYMVTFEGKEFQITFHRILSMTTEHLKEHLQQIEANLLWMADEP